MTDQPPNQSQTGEQGDEPAQLAPDAPTEIVVGRDQTTKRRSIPEEAMIAGDLPRDVSGPVPMVPPDHADDETGPASPALQPEPPREVSGPVPVPPPEPDDVPPVAPPPPPAADAAPVPPPADAAPVPPPAPAPPPVAVEPVTPPPPAPAPGPPPSHGTTEPGGRPYEPAEGGGGIGTTLATAFPPERPERMIAAAFAGGLILALILKRLAR